MSEQSSHLPGSAGEHNMQERYKTQDRAKSFYDRQMLDYLAELMQEFIAHQEMVFISTSDAQGECDCSLRTGDAGFIQVLNDKTLAFPDYKGNGVLASLGNISENPHIGLLFIDFFEDKVGLHVNGKVKTLDSQTLKKMHSNIMIDEKAVFWTLISVEEAYIHCSKNIPLFNKRPQDEPIGKSCMVDYFQLQNL